MAHDTDSYIFGGPTFTTDKATRKVKDAKEELRMPGPDGDEHAMHQYIAGKHATPEEMHRINHGDGIPQVEVNGPNETKVVK